MDRTIFQDRRQQSDRRKASKRSKKLGKKCQRSGDRRSGTFESKPWWLKTNYCEHVLSPKLLIDNKDQSQQADSDKPKAKSQKNSSRNQPKQA